MNLGNSAAGTAARPASFYFGWRIVAAMFIVTTMVFGNTLYAFIIFSAPIAKEYGWSTTQAGSLVSAMWVAAPLALFVAPIIRKLGPIRLLLAGMLLQACALAAVSQIGEFWHLYLLRLAMGAGKVLTLVTVPVLVSRWFSARFSTAMALAWCGGSFGGLIMSPLAERIVAETGWQGAAIAFGIIHAVAAAIMLILCRGPSAPGDIGLSADGEPAALAVNRQSDDLADAVSAREALRAIHPATAIPMAIAVLLTGAGAISMLSVMPALFESGGLSAATAATLFGIMAGSSALGQPVVGWVLDRARVPVANIAVGVALFGGAACVALLQTQPGLVGLAFVAAVLWGLGMGANEMIWITLTKRQFGTRLFAYTYGAWSCSIQAGYALGGPIGGWTYDHTSATVFPLLAGLLYLPAVIAAMWRPGIRNEE